MKPQQSRLLAERLNGPLCMVMLALAGCASTAWAQTAAVSSDGPFRLVTELPGRAVAIAHDVAIVAGSESDSLNVFERTAHEPDGERWEHVGGLVPSDGGEGFGRRVSTDGNTIVVGASGAAYVFERDPDSGLWREAARLTSDLNTISFATSVGVSGRTVAVGAPVADGEPPLTGTAGTGPGPGIVFVFERDESSASWVEAGRLGSGWSCEITCQGQFDLFGTTVSLENDTLVVGANTRFQATSAMTTPVAHVFSRQAGTSDTWVPEAMLFAPLALPDHVPMARASISGDTVVIASSVFNRFVQRYHGLAWIYQRNHGGSGGWASVAQLLANEGQPDFRGVRTVNISGDVAVVNAEDDVAYVFIRNQGGPDRWEEVARFPQNAVISGDTLLVGSPARVYVLDTDRDGVRDGTDSCPRDPLNNVEGGCWRDSTKYALLDALITLGPVEIESSGQPFVIRGTFTNNSETTIANPFFEVTELTGGNELSNSDAGAGGVGASLSPDVADGILSPGESTTVRFVIRLETRDPFSFRVSVRGDSGP